MIVKNVDLQTAKVWAPTAYRLSAVYLTNHAGRTVEIHNIVVSIAVVESIYTQHLRLELEVKDATNLLEEMSLSGQERLRIVIDRHGPFDAERVTIDKEFLVTEYPVFGSASNRTQVYKMIAISPHAFLSGLVTISRAVSGNIAEIVKNILVRDLHYPAKDIHLGKFTSSAVTAVIPRMAPLDAIHWLLRRAFCTNSTPFFCYETMAGGMRIESLAEMISRDSHQSYNQGAFFNADPFTAEDYRQHATRIVSMSSDLNLSKLLGAGSGAYASTTFTLDLSEKTPTIEYYDYLKYWNQMYSLDATATLSREFKPDGQKNLTQYTEARVNCISTNQHLSGRYDTPSYNDLAKNQALARMQSYSENLAMTSHELTVAGDLKITPGYNVKLSMPKAIDPGAATKNAERKAISSGMDEDEFLSGDYIVTAIKHLFEGEYFCTLRLKRDSLQQNYFNIGGASQT